MNSKKRLGLWTTLEGGARSAWEKQLVEVDRLKTSIDDLKKSVSQLNDLKREYQRQISSSARDSIEQFKFLRIREFLTTIDSTLEQARAQEESLVSSLSQATEDSTSLMLEMWFGVRYYGQIAKSGKQHKQAVSYACKLANLKCNVLITHSTLPHRQRFRGFRW